MTSSASAMRLLGPAGDRVHDHAGLGALDLVDLGGLRLDREVLVDDAEAALLRHGDREARLGDRVHRGRDDRDVQPDLGASGCVRRSTSRGWTSRVGREQEDVVERQRERDLVGRSALAGSAHQLRVPPWPAVSPRRRRLSAPWHFLYFLPEPQGHGSLRPTLGWLRWTVSTLASWPPEAAAP